MTTITFNGKEQSIEEVEKKYKDMRVALKGIMGLIADGIFIRDISKDGDKSYYIRQGLRIVSSLFKASKAIDNS